jgi:uncharacterized repeat protein (TIGR04052 family)
MAAAVGAIGSAAACSGDDTVAPASDAGTTPPPTDATTPPPDAIAPPPDGGVDAGGGVVSLTFAARVGAEPFKCGTTFSLGNPATMVAPVDFRFYVSEIKLVRADGSDVPLVLIPDGKWQLPDVALLDFEDGTGACSTDGNADTNTVVRGTAPPGTYTGVRFVVGVPFSKNHANQATAPSPLNLGQMFWSWQSGYKFLKIDGQPQNDAGPRFNVHLGSIACVGGNPADGGVVTSCDKPNRAPVELLTSAPIDFATKSIVVDWAAILAGSDLTTNGGGPGGCMSFPGDPECPPVFDRLGLDYTTGQPKAGATAFRLE